MSSSGPVDSDRLRSDIVRVFDAHLVRPPWRHRAAPSKPVDAWARVVDDGRIAQLVVVECLVQQYKVDVFVKVRGFNRCWFGKSDSGLFVPRDSVLHAGPTRTPHASRARLFPSFCSHGSGLSAEGEVTQFICQKLKPFLEELTTASAVLRALEPDASPRVHGFEVWEPLTPNLRAATRACVLAALGRFDDAARELRELRTKYDPAFADMLLRRVEEQARLNARTPGTVPQCH